MEEDEETFSPFWLRQQPNTPRHRLRRSTSSLLFSSGAFVLLLLAVALAFIFVIIPSLHSFTSQLFRPNMVKKSWDSLNWVLVLFAIVCGFLGRNSAANDDGGVSVSAAAQPEEEVVKSVPSTPRQWYEYSDRTVYNDRAVNRVSSMRTSSSYPDLRQYSDQWDVTRDDRWRFNDDTHVSNYRVPDSDQMIRQHRRRASWHEEYDVTRTKTIPVDTFVMRKEQASPPSTPKADNYVPSPSPSPPPSPPHEVAPPPSKPKRTYQAVEEKDSRNADVDAKNSFRQPAPVSAAQSQPKPAALPVYEDVEAKIKKREKNVKKRGVGVATTKEFITSLRKNKKKQRQKSVENFETLLNSLAASSSSSKPLLPPPSPPPPPPPPLPPPSVFHSLFQSKKPKPKKPHHSLSQPPPPPPSPPVTSTRLSKNKAQVRPMMTAQKPPLPVKVKSFSTLEDEASNSGGDSPLMSRIPPPPPLPPFRIPETKFEVVHGDFVRIKSNNSSRSGSPDLDDGGEDSPTNETGPLSGNESPARPMFCPSSDVNTKADTFIARFRAGLRLEKINSVNERGRSNLGPDSSERLGTI